MSLDFFKFLLLHFFFILAAAFFGKPTTFDQAINNLHRANNEVQAASKLMEHTDPGDFAKFKTARKAVDLADDDFHQAQADLEALLQKDK